MQHQLAMPRQPREAMLLGDRDSCRDQRRRQRDPVPRTSTSRPLAAAVTWMSSGLLTGSSTTAARRAPRRHRARIRGAGSRIGQRSIGMMACDARGREADLEHLVRAQPRVQGDAAAAGAMGVDQRRDLAGDARPAPACRPRSCASRRDRRSLCQCWMAQPPQTPKCGQNGSIRSGLAGSTASSRRRSGWPGTAIHLDGLAAERVGHEDRRAAGEGDAVAAMADMIDGRRLSHGAHPGRIRYCRRRR